MDPFNEDNGPSTQNTTGELVFNLGNISEDVLKDSRNSFENGLPSDGTATGTDDTPWGRVPVLASIINAFDNDADKRAKQDVGLDGLGDTDEASYFTSYLSAIATNFGTGSGAYANAQKIPLEIITITTEELIMIIFKILFCSVIKCLMVKMEIQLHRVRRMTMDTMKIIQHNPLRFRIKKI